jgi:hypothetical protein
MDVVQITHLQVESYLFMQFKPQNVLISKKYLPHLQVYFWVFKNIYTYLIYLKYHDELL